MILGGVYVVLGLALFLMGLEKALFPVGKIMATQLSDPAFIGATSGGPDQTGGRITGFIFLLH